MLLQESGASLLSRAFIWQKRTIHNHYRVLILRSLCIKFPLSVDLSYREISRHEINKLEEGPYCATFKIPGFSDPTTEM